MKTLEEILYNPRLMFMVFVLLMLVVCIKVFYFPKYETEAMILIDTKQRATSVDSEKISLQDNLGPVRVNQELLLSDPILRKVVEDLKLYDDNSYLSFLKPETAPALDNKKERLIRKKIEILRKSVITTSSPPFTSLIVVKARYKDAQMAADIVNHLIEDYIQWHISFNHSEVGNVMLYLDKEVERANQRLFKSEEELKKFKLVNNIVNLQEEVRTYLQMIPEEFKAQYLYDRSNQVQVLSMQSSINLETQKALFGQKQSIVTKLLDLEVELMHLKDLYTDESPEVKYMKNNIQELKDKLKAISRQIELQDVSSKNYIAEVSRKINNYKNDYKLDEKYLDHFKNLPLKEMMLDRLQRAVRINEAQYSFLVDEQQKASLIQAKETTENIKIVSSALVPLKPKGRVIGLVIGCFISLIFSAGLPLAWRHRKILIG